MIFLGILIGFILFPIVLAWRIIKVYRKDPEMLEKWFEDLRTAAKRFDE